LFCSGTFSFKRTNEFAIAVISEIESAFEKFDFDEEALNK